MKNYILRNTLHLLTALGVAVVVYVVANWDGLPVLQRVDGLFFCALIMHLWEENRFPGGFTEMITRALHFTQADPHFGEIITSSLVLLIGFLPLFFPGVAFLAVVPLLLGLLEPVAHLLAIRMNDKSRFYSPGLVTAVVLLLPVSLYGIIYAVQHDLMQPLSWLFCFIYMLAALMIAQQIVVRASGMKYSEFLRKARGALLRK